MRLITMYKNLGEAKVEFYGCPLGCKYCAHRIREKREVTAEQVSKFVAGYDIKRIFFGGAEPALFKKDLVDIIRVMSKRGKEITLKTTGSDPEFVRATVDYVHHYIIEVKAPLDDVQGMMRLVNLDEERTKEYLANLRACLELLKGRKVRATVRVIPTVIDRDKIERLGRQLHGYVDEVQLIQFMSGMNDLPFEGISKPSPPIEEVEAMGDIMLKYVPMVILQGDGFDSTLRA
ncbi:MAG: radical SAM protein [Methanomassiliicoccales archaeon]|nr:radical SAM protein [Methanomassiliicoccales archaeon]MDD1755884.1 radical SAM protein [Methanomassiliicoccales archaeon]